MRSISDDLQVLKMLAVFFIMMVVVNSFMILMFDILMEFIFNFILCRFKTWNFPNKSDCLRGIYLGFKISAVLFAILGLFIYFILCFSIYISRYRILNEECIDD